MITITIKGMDKLEAHLRGLEKQADYALSVAINKTAQDVQAAVRDEMNRVFSAPTPWTLRNVRVRYATKQTLKATVYFGDRLFSKSRNSPTSILAHEFSGGGRIGTGLEAYLKSAGLISSGEFVVPGAGARIDRYGNMSRGQIQQVMSQLRLGLDSASWSSKSSSSKRSVRRAGRIFWSRGGHLPRGAWIDMGVGVGVRPLLVVVGGTAYRQRLDMGKVGAATVARVFPGHFSAAMKRAIATAR